MKESIQDLVAKLNDTHDHLILNILSLEHCNDAPSRRLVTVSLTKRYLSLKERLEREILGE